MKDGKKPIDKKPSGSGLNLDGLGDLSDLLSQPETAMASPGPLMLRLSVIDEDLNQPRKYFSQESLEEISETIRLRGVKTPISVHPHPEKMGRYVINHGARRYRGSKMAGKEDIPAFIDDDYTEADQVIENLHRDGLTSREVADFIGRELSKGKKKGEVAELIGKSPAFVTQHVTLLNLPDQITDVFNLGRCKDITVINELVTAHKKKPKEVNTWLADESQEITRGTVKLLREYLAEKGKVVELNGVTEDSENENEIGPKEKKTPKELDPEKLKKPIVQVQHDDRPARLILNRRPTGEGSAWMKYEDDGEEFEAKLSQVVLIALLEG